MRILAERCHAVPTCPEEYRFLSNPFYFKFCYRTAHDLDEFAPLPGFYVPLPLIDLADQSGRFTGPRGGRLITRQALSRVLNHTHFVGLAVAGVIGSCGADSTWIKELIAESLKKSRSVVFAHGT